MDKIHSKKLILMILMSDHKVSFSQQKNKYYDSVDILNTKKSCYKTAVTLLIIKYVSKGCKTFP